MQIFRSLRRNRKSSKKTAGSTHDCIEHGDQSDNYQRIIDAFLHQRDFPNSSMI